MTAGGTTGFGSDNHAGAHPDVLDAVAAASAGHAPAYGADPWTARAVAAIRGHVGEDAGVWPVLTGSAANVLCFRALKRGDYDAVICAETAHVNVDECGAPERIGGVKLLTVPTPDGRLTPELVATRMRRIGDAHAAQPRIVSVSEATELGTVYTPDELRALADHAHAHGLLLHVDGARIANAAAFLGVGLAALTRDAGVDALSLGATKNGALAAEAVVLLTPAARAAAMAFERKQALQLASKMRFVSAQLAALYDESLWRRLAAHANAMAARLAAAVADDVDVSRPVESNAVFARLAPEAASRLRESWAFHVWDESTGEVRWMCAWDTTPADVDAFAADVRAAVAAAAGGTRGVPSGGDALAAGHRDLE